LKILISNDDGYRAEGIKRLREALLPLGDVTVVAPDRNRSGASNSLTLDVPLRVFEAEPGIHFVVGGTPTDCVHMAVSGLLPERQDMVVSGINDGENLGDDVLYSGTVAAAIEGRFLGLSAVAISLAMQPDSDRNFSAAVRKPPDNPLILNVNVPDLPISMIKGFRTTRLGFRHQSEPVVRAQDPRGRPVYWVGPAGGHLDAAEGTDFHAVQNGYVSVTPLQIDLTRHAAIPAVQSWLDDLNG
jgi:5'-nucleotidase